MSKMNIEMREFMHGFRRGMIGTLRYGYFAPITALYLAATRKGGYLRHFMALHRLCSGRWDLDAIRKRTSIGNRTSKDRS